MKKFNVICFNMSRYGDWEQSGVVNRNYHILHTLAKDQRINRIIAVDFLPFTWKRAIKSFIKDQIFRDRRGEVILGNITSQAWQVSSKITVYSTINSILNPKKIIQELKRIIHKQGMGENLLAWNFNPLYTEYFGELGQVANIFDAVDNWAEHSSYINYKNILENNYRKLVEKSDLIYTVSEDLVSYLKSDHTHWLPNAVDFDHFQTIETSPVVEKIPKPRIGFLGILQDRIDTDLIKFIAEKHPDKSIILAGPVWKNFPKAELEQFKNIYFIGPISYKDMPKVYHSFDVGIIPYKMNAFIKSTNSMKFYEYLAAGLPVVSTRSGGAEAFGDLIYIADNKEEFSNKITQAITENSQNLVEKREVFVVPHSWQTRLEQVFNDLEKLT